MDIKYEMLKKEINNGNLKSMYLLYGNEKYLIDTLLKKIKKQFGNLLQGINYIVMDETNVQDLIFNMQIPAFGYDKKLILVQNAGLFKKDGRKKEGTPLQKEVSLFIEENNTLIEETLVLVFVEEEIDKNDVYQAVYKNGMVCQIDELKPNQLITKLKQVCTLYQVKVEEKTLNHLLEIAGTNLQILISEIRKLIEYTGSGGEITTEAIDLLTVKQIESVIFDLTDHLGNKKIDKAIQVLENLMYQKEPLQKILITLYNHFKKLYLCRMAINLNKDIAIALNLKSNQMFLVR